MPELYDAKDVLETVVCSMDFTPALAGATITACVVDVIREDGKLEDTTAMVVGGVDLSAAPIMKQKIAGGNHGVNYIVRFKASLSDTRVITGSAVMLVRNGA